MSVLMAVVGVASGAAAVRSDPVKPLRTITRWSLQWRGARFTNGVARQQTSLSDCGAVALADLLALTGRNVPAPEFVRRASSTTSAGTTLGNLEMASAEFGLRLFAVKWDPHELALLPLPALVWVEKRHFVVVARRTFPDSVEVLDPAAGAYRMASGRFARLWSGEALIRLDSFSPPPPETPGAPAADPQPVGHTGTHDQSDGGTQW
jgi:predicted double-glycine peptidase